MLQYHWYSLNAIFVFVYATITFCSDEKKYIIWKIPEVILEIHKNYEELKDNHIHVEKWPI